MPITDATIGNVTPNIQTINWTRGTSFPHIADLYVTSRNADNVEVSIQFIGTSIQWLKFEGYTGSFFYLDDFSNSATLNIDAQSLDLLVNNNYKAIIQFTFSKYEGANKVVTVEINLAITGSFGVQTDQAIYNVIFNRANNSLTGETTVGIVNNTEDKLLSFWQPSDIFEPKTGFIDDFEINDNTVLSIADNPDIPVNGVINHQCRIMGPDSSVLTNFEIDLLILNDNGIGASPESLAFEVIKDTSEKSSVLKVTNPLSLDFTLESSDWLIISETSGNSSKDINITTKTDALEPGTHSGFVKIIFDGGNINISVQLILKQFIKIDESSDFCLDISPVSFGRINELGSYVRVTMKATYTVLGIETIFEKPFIIPYIDDQASFSLGRKLHNYFPRVKKSLFDFPNSSEFMKSINCDLVVEELDLDYKTLMTESISGLKFLPGNKPKMFPVLSNYGHRKFNNGSQFFLTHITGESVYLEKTTVAPKSDIISYYEFPKSFRPVHAQWENQNLLPEWFTFTGDYTISADFTHLTSKNVLTSLMQKFDTAKIKKLSINTGFMLAQELEMMEEMIMNRLVFVQIEDKIYQCYNATVKMVLESSSQDIIERDLEFIIVEK